MASVAYSQIRSFKHSISISQNPPPQYIDGGSGVDGFDGSGQVRHRQLPVPTPNPSTKILTGFLRFAWTPLGSSGCPDLRTLPDSYAAVRGSTVNFPGGI